MPATKDAPIVLRGLYWAANTVASLISRKRCAGAEHIPQSGPALVVANHTSNYDTIALGDFIISHGRWPRFLGKSEIWKVPFIGWLARESRQIPVERHTERAKDSLIHAREALEAGDIVAIYPEGTITRDPAGWPMLARRGAARLALMTGVPVIPAAIKGADAILGGRYLELGKMFGSREREVTVVAGPPVDLSDLPVTDDPTEEHIQEATRRIMQTISTMYGQLRDEQVPELVWDPWKKTYAER